MIDKKEYCNRCIICKTEYPLDDKTEICPLCDGEIQFNVLKKKPLLIRILFGTFNFSFKNKNKDEFYIKTDENGKKTYHSVTKPKKKKKSLIFKVNVIKLALIIGSIVLAFKGVEGWGWLLFLTLIVFD